MQRNCKTRQPIMGPCWIFLCPVVSHHTQTNITVAAAEFTVSSNAFETSAYYFETGGSFLLGICTKNICISETGTSPSLDRASVTTLCLSHYVTETSHLHNLRDFWRHFGLYRATAHSDCCFFAPCTNILTYLLTYFQFSYISVWY